MEYSHPVLVVPVCASAPGVCRLLTCRLPDGTRCGVAFTSAAVAARVMGPTTGLIELALPALRAMLTPLGIERVQVDPDLVAPVLGHGRVA